MAASAEVKKGGAATPLPFWLVMRYIKLFPPIFIAIIFSLLAFLLPAPPALAQEPEGVCIPVITYTTFLATYNDAAKKIDTETPEYIADPADAANALGPADGVNATLNAVTNTRNRFSFSPDVVLSGTITITTKYENYNLWESKIHVNPKLNASAIDDEWTVKNFMSGVHVGQIGSIGFNSVAGVMSSGYSYLDAITLTLTGCYYYITPTMYLTCPTVTDFDFTGSPTDTWTLDGSAAIVSSTLTLNPGGSVSQTLSTTLQTYTTYNAVISVTNAITAPLVMLLDSQAQTITVDAPGFYTATFTTTSAISGPVYLLKNEGESEHYIDIDWTCVYQGAGGVLVGCIAPLNGEFATNENWDWYRGAAWNAPDENAFLPFNQGGDANRALVVSTAAYSLPTLGGGQYLLMQFNATAGGGQEVIVASRVLSAWKEFNVSGAEVYTYEHDISSMAGQTVTVAFANAGDDGSAGAAECEFPAQDSVVLDNICIYVADRPAADPPPTTGGFCPSDLGFDWGCADVVPLLLGYGINVQGLDDVYTTGVSVWEVQNYIPWLVAALWHNVGHPISCFILEFMRLAVGLVEYEVNIFTNYVNWVYTGAYSSPSWLQTGFFYLVRYMSNIAIAQTPGGWLAWFGNSFRVVFYNLGLNQAYTIRDINGHMREVQNPFCAASNAFVIGLESALNQIMTELIGMWNTSILPYFTASAGSTAIPAADPSAPESPWKSVLDMFLWLIQFVGQIVNTLWQLFRWLVNFLTTGATAPIDAYHSFREGIADEAYVIDVACINDNWWCVFWGGVALINATTAQSIMYPIVITGIVCLTLVIVFKNLYEMFHIDIS